MNKIHFTLSACIWVLFSSINTHAANHTIPTITPGFSMSLTGLYLQPNASNLTYAVYTKPLPLTTPNWTQVMVNPGYRASFDLGFQYHFDDVTNQASLDWLHMNASSAGSHDAPGVGDSIAPPYYFGPLAQALTGSHANSNVKFNVDNVNITAGHLINLGNHVQVDPFAGLQFAYLKQDIKSTYLGVGSDNAAYSITSNNASKFTGIGPRLSVNATYFISERLGISEKIGGSLLAGTIQSNTTFNSLGAGNANLTTTTLADQSQNRIIPAAESDLEASYTLPLQDNHSSLTFSAGYLFSIYFNGINQVVPSALVPGAFNSGVIAIESSEQNQSNLSLNGPYVSLIWKF